MSHGKTIIYNGYFVYICLIDGIKDCTLILGVGYNRRGKTEKPDVI